MKTKMNVIMMRWWWWCYVVDFINSFRSSCIIYRHSTASYQLTKYYYFKIENHSNILLIEFRFEFKWVYLDVLVCFYLFRRYTYGWLIITILLLREWLRWRWAVKMLQFLEGSGSKDGPRTRPETKVRFRGPNFWLEPGYTYLRPDPDLNPVWNSNPTRVERFNNFTETVDSKAVRPSI